MYDCINPDQRFSKPNAEGISAVLHLPYNPLLSKTATFPQKTSLHGGYPELTTADWHFQPG
jgi:hypothetical protein